MSRAEEIKEKARKLQERQQQSVPPSRSEPPVVIPAPPLHKPVRRSVDLSPAQHAQLTQWCHGAAQQLGRARVTGQDVLRQLVERLLNDEELSQHIIKNLNK